MATMTVNITESLTLNGVEQGGNTSLDITGVNDIYKRTVTVPSGADTTIATFRTAASTADGAIDLENVKYIRVSNLDSSNPINLSLQIAGGEDASPNMSTTVLISAGQSFLLWTVHDGIATDDDAATLIDALNDLESLLVDSLSQAVKVEVLVASS